MDIEQQRQFWTCPLIWIEYFTGRTCSSGDVAVIKAGDIPLWREYSGGAAAIADFAQIWFGTPVVYSKEKYVPWIPPKRDTVSHTTNQGEQHDERN